jgi:hypothetical protein
MKKQGFDPNDEGDWFDATEASSGGYFISYLKEVPRWLVRPVLEADIEYGKAFQREMQRLHEERQRG